MDAERFHPSVDKIPMLDLARFEAATLHHDPYDYFVLPDFIREAAQSSVLADFPVINEAGSFPVNTLQCGPAFLELVRQLESPEFRQAVERKFEMDLSGRPTMVTVRGHTDETDGRIHTDSTTKLITMLIYFNTGWQNMGGRLRILRSGDDLEHYADEVSPAFGTLLAFRRSDHSWHGHKPFVGERRALQLNWVISEQVKQREQQRHGVSAFFKRILHKLGLRTH
uniref:Prolyl 4-hydroxylase alpha subunit Fe(2+) 2OG dioxygenase domain-containing protein n=1 Tax=mine drainage metagenome TaxID=410659 RepID=E6QS04_9ZZZZ